MPVQHRVLLFIGDCEEAASALFLSAVAQLLERVLEFANAAFATYRNRTHGLRIPWIGAETAGCPWHVNSDSFMKL